MFGHLKSLLGIPKKPTRFSKKPTWFSEKPIRFPEKPTPSTWFLEMFTRFLEKLNRFSDKQMKVYPFPRSLPGFPNSTFSIFLYVKGRNCKFYRHGGESYNMP